MCYAKDFSYKSTSYNALDSPSKYRYNSKKNGPKLPKERIKPQFSLDNWNSANIGTMTDYIFNYSAKSDNGSSTQDNAIRSFLPEPWKQIKKTDSSASPNIPFEIAPWIAALAANNAGVSKKRVSMKKRYVTTITKTTQLLKNTKHIKHSFGYPFVHNSLGFHYAYSLVKGNQYMGTNVLGELVTSLNTSKSVEDSSTSINLINMMLEQFAISHSLFNMDNANKALNEISSNWVFTGLKNLNYESKVTNDLSTEIKNFINQVYVTHPFSRDGIAMYLKPLASQRYLSSRSLLFFPYKKNGSPNNTIGPKNPSSQSNSSTPSSVHVDAMSMVLDYDPAATDGRTATGFVNSVFTTFNESNSREISRFNLVNQLGNQQGKTIETEPVSLEKYFEFDKTAPVLLKKLNTSKDMEDLGCLFTSMDKYLTQTLLQNREMNLLPLETLSRAISHYDQHKKDAHFDSNQAKKQLLNSLTDSADTIIQYYNQWKAYVNNRFQDPSDDISNLVDQLRPIVDLLQHVHDNTDSWNNQISNH